MRTKEEQIIFDVVGIYAEKYSDNTNMVVDKSELIKLMNFMYEKGIDDCIKNAEVSLFDYIGTSFKEFKQHSNHFSINDGSYVEIDKESMSKLKKSVSGSN